MSKIIKATSPKSELAKSEITNANHTARLWLVIEDPSGDFTGNLFQTTDLQCSASESTWPDGIRFMNIRTEAIKAYRNGVLLDE